ncbi:hypothetical protein GEMRC1_011764 [Eukaryota sp. GEM-RC1]
MFSDPQLPLLPKKPQHRNLVLVLLFVFFSVTIGLGFINSILTLKWHHYAFVFALVVATFGFFYTVSLLRNNYNPQLANLATFLLIICVLLSTTVYLVGMVSRIPDAIDDCDDKSKAEGGLYATADGACFPRCNNDDVEVLVVHNDDPSRARCLPIMCVKDCYKP